MTGGTVSSSGTAVRAVNCSSTAVRAVSCSSTAVRAVSSSGTAVRAVSSSGTAVRAVSSSGEHRARVYLIRTHHTSHTLHPAHYSYSLDGLSWSSGADIATDPNITLTDGSIYRFTNRSPPPFASPSPLSPAPSPATPHFPHSPPPFASPSPLSPAPPPATPNFPHSPPPPPLPPPLLPLSSFIHSLFHPPPSFRERPQIFFNETTGNPAILFNGVCPGEKYDYAYTLAQFLGQ
jgi:hypothetical protein